MCDNVCRSVTSLVDGVVVVAMVTSRRGSRQALDQCSWVVVDLWWWYVSPDWNCATRTSFTHCETWTWSLLLATHSDTAAVTW